MRSAHPTLVCHSATRQPQARVWARVADCIAPHCDADSPHVHVYAVHLCCMRRRCGFHTWLNINTYCRANGGKAALVDKLRGRPMFFRCLHAGTQADFDQAFAAFEAAYPVGAAYVRSLD
jgi:hypothetical protein